MIPSTPSVSYTYDANYNRISSMMDGAGTTYYTYNSITTTPTLGAGKLYSIASPLPNNTITFGYDQLGRISNRSINGVAQTVTFDSLDRVSSVTNPLGTFGNFYVNATARLDHVTLLNGITTQFYYYPNQATDGSGDGNERLQEIKNLDSSQALISQFDYAYDIGGRVTTWTQANTGQTTGAQHYNFGYDLADQLLSGSLQDVSNTLLKQYGYTYDSAGNRQSEQAGSSNMSFNFNNLNQIVNRSGDVPIASGTITVTGSVNKPSFMTVNGVSLGANLVTSNFSAIVNVTTGTTNIPITATDISGNSTADTLTIKGELYAFDPDGNMNAAGLNCTFEWDAANRCTAINQGTHRTQLSYDGFNREVQRVEIENGVVTGTSQFVWCGMERCEARDGNNNVIKRFYPQGEQISGTNYYYTRDHLGSIRELTDSSGVVQARYDYDPYGLQTKLSGTINADFGYTGHFTSALWPTLAFAPYRIYNADLGQWISRDPIGEKGGLNLYGYVLNDPVLGIDPMGLTILVFGTPTFGGIANHAYIYSTETGLSYGRWASSGPSSRLAGDGGGDNTYSNQFNAVPDWELYSAGFVNDAQFMNDIKPYMDQGIWFPYLNDCHSDLENGFDQLGVPFPGVPGGRTNGMAQPIISNAAEFLFPGITGLYQLLEN